MNTFNLHDLELLKYPRTPHLEGSRLQTGDEGHFHVPYKTLAGKQIVIEEKLDGANCALRFDSYGQLFLQSRGHFLGGGGNERQFALLKKWASVHEPRLLEILTDRYIVFAEWLHKKHSVFYDSLPTYFAEFDIWDRHSNQWLDTKTRASILSPLPVLSVPVLYQGIAPKKLSDLVSFLAPSLGKSPNWKASFERTVIREKLELEKAWQLCDLNTLAEGLYIKVEENGSVVARYKWVRPDFVQTLISHNVHHSQQPYIANQLREGVDIFSPKLTENWSS
ncbi:RNA ligase family protein [Thorsellia anophelis]|uniref:RNA ligase n=1 Tax=Thorsellia anophelis DSM 18579 TaxID=1123402 RepID=A0A1I0F9C4_9GAMM|nr:RNA ligase family protein [Thorsellia anophelis]SET54521.1 RNA ligase [Thorsellia anophelis DSM 18579]